MIQLLLNSPLASTALLGIGTMFGGLVGVVATTLVKGRISHHFDRALEEHRAQLARHDRVSQLAEYLAFAWRMQNMEDMSEDEAERANKMAFELSLWLPADVVAELGRLHQGGNFWDAVFRAREWVNPGDPLNPDLVIGHDTKANMRKRLEGLGLGDTGTGNSGVTAPDFLSHQ
ncbi:MULTISPECIES: hypothetical protein [Citromicrobium]|jgi:hypothetical protein|uniref:hypothetical protein n=1 Tax=Citromicrobium TaxID=72173 RepID=UPI0001DD0644|nr:MULTISPECIES: hypothetical protein [Citromicrobium]KPM13326.1 hypothetical protein VO58_12335 [Citromicrobium sp. JL1351]KPM14860.1 hypothetical protein VM77_12920 [Citromicrobium sp. JL31]KPM22356.1 hypothetical protein VO57_13025 [Citromicrobium sp. JL2201]